MTQPSTPFLRAAALAAIIVPTLSHPQAARGEAEYEVLLVEAFNEEYSLREVYLRDINEAGVACGTSTYGSSYAGFSWTRDADKSLVPITWTRGINNLGQIVGDDRLYDTETLQSVTIPPTGGYPLTRVHGINDNGIVVGFAECQCSNSDGVVQTALVWDAANGSRATGVTAARELLRINESNVACGNIRPSAGSSEAFVYDVDTGEHTNLSDLLPDPPFGRAWSEAADINSAGEVCGQAYDGNSVVGMVWSPADGFTYLPALDGGDPTRVHPMGMNDQGVVVGRALSGATGDWDGFIWDSVGGMRSLDDLFEGGGTFTTDWGVEINDQGWIVGIGHYGPGWSTARGFVLVPLDPADAPEAIALGLSGLRVTPNPASSMVEIEWTEGDLGGADTDVFGLRPSAAGSDARLTLFDAAGRTVATLGTRHRERGSRARWSWTIPRSLPAGVYPVRLETGNRIVRGKVVLAR